MTRSEFLQFASLDKPKLHHILAGRSFQTCLTFRREIQVALVSYSKNTGGRDDAIKATVVGHLHQIESWLREAYFRRRLPEVLTQNASLLFKGKAAAKSIIRKEWETLIAGASY